MKRFLRMLRLCSIFAVPLANAVLSPAPTVTTLVNFTAAGGYASTAPLIQGTDGKFYGTTVYGGAHNGGTVFTVTPAGKQSTLYSFCAEANCSDGQNPWGLVHAIDGKFYGATAAGGAFNYGTFFKITPSGKLTILHSFALADGQGPNAGVMQGADGNFYGTTGLGGTYGYGDVFKVTPTGTLTVLYSFCAQTNCTDGKFPAAALLQAPDGNFYSTTWGGGIHGYGTVFKITPQGALTILHSFNSFDGVEPESALVQGRDGNFYGTTYGGGTNLSGTLYKITGAGTLTTLYNFCSLANCADGEIPEMSLILGSDGKLYGTAFAGGANEGCYYGEGCGTIFDFSAGTLKTVYSFCSQPDCSDGEIPTTGALLQATNGFFYGATRYGGSNGVGTIFRLSMGLSPFVQTEPTFGGTEAKVTILGNNLAGATKVSFHGTAATFKVVSSTEIKTTVPTGATSGTVQVTTPVGTLNSNVGFQVTH